VNAASIRVDLRSDVGLHQYDAVTMGHTSSDRTSLRRRVGVLGCVFVALVVFSVGLCTLMVRTWGQAVDERGNLRVAAAEVAQLRLAYSDQETGVRGYLLSGDSSFLDPFDHGLALAQAMQERLREKAARLGIDLDPQVDRVEAAGERWRDDVARPAIDDPTETIDEEVARARFDDVRAELDGLDSIVARALEHAMERTDTVRRNTLAVLIASAVAAFAAIALIAILFRRWITQPLAQIGASARALSSDETQQLPDFDSAELQDVVEAIRTLQGSLAHERDRAVTAYRALEQSAVLAVHVRSELADEIGDPPPGWAVGSALLPADGVVAGDCFDMGLLDQHHLYVVLVDVTGHGPGAALDALKSKSQLRAALRSRVSPGGALDWLSRENRKDARADLLTAVVAIIDVDTGLCQYANAGHPSPFLTNGSETIELRQTGPLLGAFDSSWRTETVTIEPGWTLLLHTDGVTEALGEQRQRFGEQRFRDLLRHSHIDDPKDLVGEVLAGVASFRVGQRTDDVTLVALHRSAERVSSGLHVVAMDTVSS
jgi:serine phosphatase RsbU (regulator of sigma subunit)/CHASE3 domain sensor protein